MENSKSLDSKLKITAIIAIIVVAVALVYFLVIKSSNEPTLEEQLIEDLPVEQDNLSDKQKYALQNLIKRKEIIQLEDKKEIIDITAE